MSTLNDILKAVGEVVVMNERVSVLGSHVERLESDDGDLRDRVIRLDAFIDMVRPAVTRRLLPPSDQ